MVKVKVKEAGYMNSVRLPGSQGKGFYGKGQGRYSCINSLS